MPLRTWVSFASAAIALSLLGSCALEQSARQYFVGSERCSGCHAPQYSSWKDTYHAKMVRTREEGLLKQSGELWARDARGNPGPTRGNIDGKPYGLNDVVFVIGDGEEVFNFGTNPLDPASGP